MQISRYLLLKLDDLNKSNSRRAKKKLITGDQIQTVIFFRLSDKN